MIKYMKKQGKAVDANSIQQNNKLDLFMLAKEVEVMCDKIGSAGVPDNLGK
jgi:hypothetical protein